MALKTKLQQLFNRSSKKQNEYLLAQENAMSEYQQYKTKFGTTIAEAELSYAVSNELFENWRANYKDVNTNRFDAAWRYIDNKDFIDSLKTDDLPSWVRKKDPVLDGIFVPDDAHFVDIVSLNYDELEEYRPDLYYGYKTAIRGQYYYIHYLKTMLRLNNVNYKKKLSFNTVQSNIVDALINEAVNDTTFTK